MCTRPENSDKRVVRVLTVMRVGEATWRGGAAEGSRGVAPARGRTSAMARNRRGAQAFPLRRREHPVLAAVLHQLGVGPDPAHEAGGAVAACGEQEMANLVRHRPAEQHAVVEVRPLSHRHHAVMEDGGQHAAAGHRVEGGEAEGGPGPSRSRRWTPSRAWDAPGRGAVAQSESRGRAGRARHGSATPRCGSCSRSSPPRFPPLRAALQTSAWRPRVRRDHRCWRRNPDQSSRLARANVGSHGCDRDEPESNDERRTNGL